MPPSIFLHIGRSKTGSTTIQSLATDHRAFMETAGVSCPLTPDGQSSNHAALAAALRIPLGNPLRDDGAALEKFNDDLAAAGGRKVFVSAETLCEITEGGVQRLSDILSPYEVKILLYVREYPGWVTSRYAQAVRFAERADDFDSYFRVLRKRVSIVPALRHWVAAFGAKALHVRPMDPAALQGGTLIGDVLHALGVAAPPPEVPPLAVAPHWIMLELQRALADAAAKAPIGKVDRRSGRLMRQLLEPCVAGARPSRVQYLTRMQWRDMAQLYRADMEVIGEIVGRKFPVTLEEPPERQFLPSLAAVPSDVRAVMLARMTANGRPARVRADVFGLIEKLLSSRASV